MYTFRPRSKNPEDAKDKRQIWGIFGIIKHLPVTKRNTTKLLLGSVEICEEID